MFYKPTPKQSLDSRNKLFLENGLSVLKEQGFEKSPFPSHEFGRNSLNGFTYVLCRLKDGNELQTIETHILKNENWIQIRLNIFKLKPIISSLSELEDSDGLKYHLPPNNLSEMRLRLDTYNCIPLIYMLFLPEHKIELFFTKIGYKRKLKKLSNLIEKDMRNIDSYIRKWKEKHTPKIVNWNGEIITDKKNTTHNKT